MFTSLIVVYNTEFSRWIRAENQKRVFCEFPIITFPYLVQGLCDALGVLAFPVTNHMVESTHTANIELIKDDSNPIVTYRSPHSISAGAAYFKSPFVLVKHVDRLILGGNVEMGYK